MLSFLLPKTIKIYHAPGFIKLEGPSSYLLKKVDSSRFSRVHTTEGIRLFITGNPKKISSVLIHRYQLVKGQIFGYRRRLRLVGIGFRARHNRTPSPVTITFIKNYIRKRINFSDYKHQQLALKIGYSHEAIYPLLSDISVKVSRLDSRSKATLILLQSNQISRITQIASEIRSFRLPDVYKGKGIYYNREVIKLKKGKRQS